MKKSICFVDDDKEEIRRFCENMGDRYVVGAGTTLDEALEVLQKARVKKPDIFLIDLYYGPETPAELHAQIVAADEELAVKEAEVRGLLVKAGQSPQGGFNLVEEAQKRFPGVPRMFFSRKAFLEDALRAQEQGLPVLAKPDPDGSDKGSTRERYDAAFRRHADQIARTLDRIVDLNAWWIRNRQKVDGFFMGFVFFLVKIGWDLRKTSIPAAILPWILSIICLVYVFARKRP